MCGVGDVAKYVLLSGDPRRVEKISSFFDEVRKVADYRGYITYTGKVGDVEISACPTGIGGPSAAIVVEELANVGAKTFIRVGTTGAIQPNIEVGDNIIATAAVRGEGTSKIYVPVEYPAIADIDVTLALTQAAEKLGMKPHVGIVATTDTFYVDESNVWMKTNVLSVEMECSTIFTLASLKGLKAGAILAVDGNLLKGVEKGEFEPGEKIGELDERVQKSIEREIIAAIEAVKILEG
jgi:uridine phosphorylase